VTKSQINKLGERLRASTSPDLASLAKLQEFRTVYDAPLRKVESVLREKVGTDATWRLKTVNTIIEKLRREKTRLAEMQDIAGIRVVRESLLEEQTALAATIVELFPGAKLIDRRAKPQHGYRAVHIIPIVDGRPVEIQIRTSLQDLWAQAMEKLADEVGREIRYGAAPRERKEDFHALMQSSVELAGLEANLQEAFDLRRDHDSLVQGTHPALADVHLDLERNPDSARVFSEVLEDHGRRILAAERHLREKAQGLRDNLGKMIR